MHRPDPLPLAHAFRLIAFDWDGTAVATRNEDGRIVAASIVRLLALGVLICVITGTNRSLLDRQLVAHVPPPLRKNLYLFTNRGSEVFGFDTGGDLRLLWHRSASAREEQLLTDIAEAARTEIQGRTGLSVDLILGRLNRRKIDLIPLAEWRDPPKAKLPFLRAAVETRLQEGGLPGGLAEAIDIAERIARNAGLADARVTSDAKHLEIGLTDKGDSARWIWKDLADPGGIKASDVLFVGDEFALTPLLPGSDARMKTPETARAVFVSVGPEPAGVPAWVIHLPGGPERFGDLLASQIQASLAGNGGFEPPTQESLWVLVEEGFQRAREHEVESLLAVSNGLVGVRGSLAEGGVYSSPATLVAGVFIRPVLSATGTTLVVAPDWLNLKARVGDLPLTLATGAQLEHRRILDLRGGVLWRIWRHRDEAGQTTRVVEMRLASLADRHVLLQVVTFVPENYCGTLTLETALPGAEPMAGAAGPVGARIPVGGSQVLALAALARLSDSDGREIAGTTRVSDGRFAWRWETEVEIGKAYRLERLVAIYATRHAAEPMSAARQHLAGLSHAASRLAADHRVAWADRWKTATIEVTGSEALTRALRFGAYHLIGAANPADGAISIGARGLTGVGYRGHVFWDTEAFMLPFFVSTRPAAARALLSYRFATLARAKERARARGYRGALFAWESTDTGDDATPASVTTPDGQVIQIASGEQEHHVSAAIAYGVWSYWQATADEAFLCQAGAELLIETARFWASRCQLAADGLFHIRHVLGPDEYHEDVDDSAYTNGMARWNLQRGAEVVRLVQERWPEAWRILASKLSLTQQEADRWKELADRIYTGFSVETGLYEQFDGFFELEEVPRQIYRGAEIPPDVLLGRERVMETQIVKQADVLMLLWMLRDEVQEGVLAANYRYYESRCAHGSSLSPSIHAALAARLGELELAERYLVQAAEVDLTNNMGSAAVGVHLGAAGGLWQAAVLGFGGMRCGTDGLEFDPRIPPSWGKLRFRVEWRGRLVEVSAGPEEVEIQSLTGDAMQIGLRPGPSVRLEPGSTACLRAGPAGADARPEGGS